MKQTERNINSDIQYFAETVIHMGYYAKNLGKKVFDLIAPLEDAERTSIRIPFLDKYLEKRNDQCNDYKLMFRTYNPEEILEYLANRKLVEKVKSLVPFSQANLRKTAAERTLSDILDGTALTRSVLDKLPDGSKEE